MSHVIVFCVLTRSHASSFTAAATSLSSSPDMDAPDISQLEAAARAVVYDARRHGRLELGSFLAKCHLGANRTAIVRSRPAWSAKH